VRNTEHNNTIYLFVVRNPINIKAWTVVNLPGPCLFIINIDFIKGLIIFNEMTSTFEISNIA
jgi:hypothetical protein